MKFNIVFSIINFFINFFYVFHTIHVHHCGLRHNHLLPNLLQQLPNRSPCFYMVGIFSFFPPQKLGGSFSYVTLCYKIAQIYKAHKSQSESCKLYNAYSSCLICPSHPYFSSLISYYLPFTILVLT